MATLSKNFKNDIVSNANKVDPIVVIADIEVADITHKQTFIPLESFSSIQTSVGYGEEGKTLNPRNIIKDISNIRNNLDIETRKLTSNVFRCRLFNYFDVATKLHNSPEYLPSEDNINPNLTFSGKYLLLYLKTNTTNTISTIYGTEELNDTDCALKFVGKISRVKQDDKYITIQAEDFTQDFIGSTEVPKANVGDISIEDYGTPTNAVETDPIPMVYGRVSRSPAIQFTDNDGIRLLHDNYKINKFESQGKIKMASEGSHIFFDDDEDYVNFIGTTETFTDNGLGKAVSLYQVTGGGIEGGLVNYERLDQIAICQNFILPKGGKTTGSINSGSIKDLPSETGEGYSSAAARDLASNANKAFYWKYNNHPDNNTAWGSSHGSTWGVAQYNSSLVEKGRWFFITFKEAFKFTGIYADINIGQDSIPNGAVSGEQPLKLYFLPFCNEVFMDENLSSNSLSNILENVTQDGNRSYSTNYFHASLYGIENSLGYLNRYWGANWLGSHSQTDGEISYSRNYQQHNIDGQPIGFLETNKLLMFEFYPDQGQNNARSYYKIGNLAASTEVKINNPAKKKVYCSIQGRNNLVSTEPFFAVPHLYQWLQGFVSYDRYRFGQNQSYPNFEIMENQIMENLYNKRQEGIFLRKFSMFGGDYDFFHQWDDAVPMRSDKWLKINFDSFIKKILLGLQTKEIFDNNLEPYLLTEDAAQTYDFNVGGFHYSWYYSGVIGYTLNFGNPVYWEQGQGTEGTELWQSEFRNSDFYADNNFGGDGSIGWFDYLWDKYADHIRCIVRYLIRSIYIIPIDQFPSNEAVDNIWGELVPEYASGIPSVADQTLEYYDYDADVVLTGTFVEALELQISQVGESDFVDIIYHYLPSYHDMIISNLQEGIYINDDIGRDSLFTLRESSAHSGEVGYEEYTDEQKLHYIHGDIEWDALLHNMEEAGLSEVNITTDGYIRKPCDIVLDILVNECGFGKRIDPSHGHETINVNLFDSKGFTEARSMYANWHMGFAIDEKIVAKELIEDLLSETMSLASYSGDGQFNFVNIKSKYNLSDVEWVIDKNSIINHKIFKSKREHMTYSARGLYDWDNGLELFREITTNFNAISMLPEYSTQYNNMIGFDDDIIYSYIKEIELKYHTTQEGDNHSYTPDEYIKWYVLNNCNQHLMIEFDADITHAGIEVGDKIHIPLINNEKVFGQDYTKVEKINGQWVYPLWLVVGTDLKVMGTSVPKIKITAYQLHHLTTDLEHGWFDIPEEEDVDDGLDDDDLIPDEEEVTVYAVLDEMNTIDPTVHNWNYLPPEEMDGAYTYINDPSQQIPYFDANGDGSLNIADVVNIVNHILEGSVLSEDAQERIMFYEIWSRTILTSPQTINVVLMVAFVNYIFED